MGRVVSRLPGDRPARSAIALALLSTCSEAVRIEAATTVLMGIQDPEACTDVMAAGRAIHGHGALLAEFLPMAGQGEGGRA